MKNKDGAPQVYLYKAFNVLSQKRGMKKFKEFIEKNFVNGNNQDKQYGLIANNKLLMSTSVFNKAY